MKKLIFKKEAREKLAKGVEIMYDAVGTTLSPKGRNVAISRQWGIPIVVHDGVTVAREVEDKDEFVNMGINLVREAASKTNEEAGDGTTTSTVLAHHIVQKGMKLLEDGHNPMVIRKQMEDVIPLLKEAIKKIAVPTDKPEDVERVAFISSADEAIGKTVAEAINKVGKNGLVTVEEGKSTETAVDYTEGMEFEKGYSAPHFITNPDRLEAVIEDPAVVVLGKRITMVKEIMPLLEVVASKNKNILIVGEVQGDALSSVVVNKMKGIINVVVVEPPGYADRKTNAIDDIALITGATTVSDELGMDMQAFQNAFDKKWIGSAKRVISSRNTTVIIRYEEEDFISAEDKKVIVERNAKVDERIKMLQGQKETEKSVFELEKVSERLAKLTTGVGVIKVGAKTEIDMREKVERTKDAVGAARAVLEEGLVPGGGVAFLQIANIFKLHPENPGEQLLFDVLQEPIRKILLNCGMDEREQDKIIQEVNEKGKNIGYNAGNGKVEDLVKAGVIDPAKVIRLALENAISVAGSILTTDVLIADELEKVPQMQMQ